MSCAKGCVVVRQVVPILRAGLVLLEQATTVLPASETYHVGYVRDESTLKAREYLNKLPASLDAEDRILITDPMLATGMRPRMGLHVPSVVALCRVPPFTRQRQSLFCLAQCSKTRARSGYTTSVQSK